MSVYAIDLPTNKVVDRYKPGFAIGQMVEGAEVVGGASPNSLAVGSRFAYVTNATNDNIAVIDYRAHTIVRHIPIRVVCYLLSWVWCGPQRRSAFCRTGTGDLYRVYPE